MRYRYSDGVPPDVASGHGRGSLKWDSGKVAQRVRWDSVQGNEDGKSIVGGGHLRPGRGGGCVNPGLQGLFSTWLIRERGSESVAAPANIVGSPISPPSLHLAVGDCLTPVE